MYGSSPLEDVINYNVIARMLTEWTSSSGQIADQTSIADGIGGCMQLSPLSGSSSVRSALHGRVSLGIVNTDVPKGANLTRRYQVTLGLGLLTQGKLLPTKFMASQLAIEITLAKPEDCIIGCGKPGGATAASFSGTTYSVQNVNMIPEILEFDSSYDNMFLKGLQEGGVPIKFSSWHTYQFSHGGTTSANILIQERSRSVKSIFTVIRRQNPTILNDSGTTFANLISGQSLESYQYRIGGRYFPASPVQVGTAVNTGGAEAFLELQKALHTVGDARLSTNASHLNWNTPFAPIAIPGAAMSTNESDGSYFSVLDGTTYPAGDPDLNNPANTFAAAVPISAAGSTAFCFATCLETTSGMEISGLNAEEQSDISLNIKWTGASAGSEFIIETYVFYDAMIVLRENNVFLLVTIGVGTNSVKATSVIIIKYVFTVHGLY